MFSTAAAPICISTNRVKDSFFFFFHVLLNIYGLFGDNCSEGMKWHFILVLLCSTLMTGDVKHMTFFPVCIVDFICYQFSGSESSHHFWLFLHFSLWNIVLWSWESCWHQGNKIKYKRNEIPWILVAGFTYPFFLLLMPYHLEEVVNLLDIFFRVIPLTWWFTLSYRIPSEKPSLWMCSFQTLCQCF